VPPHFVSEPLEPQSESFDAATIARGEPSLPASFTWRERTLAVQTLLRTWRSYRTDRGDKYVARHYFEFVVRDGSRAVVYCERQTRKPGAPRWWLYTLSSRAERPQGA
jgi:hypothetical protein